MAFFFFVVFSSLSTVLVTGEVDCFVHGREDERIRVTCTNVTRYTGCQVDRNGPLFDVPAKSNPQPFSIVCYSEPSNSSNLNKVGFCTCEECYAGNSTCTLTLNTTQLTKLQVVWKFCNEQVIDLTVDNNSTNKHTQFPAICEQKPAKDVSVNIAGAVAAPIACVAIVTIIIIIIISVWLLKRRRLRTRGKHSSTGEEGVRLNTIHH